MHSRIGLKLTKFHVLLHFHHFIKEFGAPLNFFGGHLEEFLKHFVKKFMQEQQGNIPDTYLILLLGYKILNVFRDGKRIKGFTNLSTIHHCPVPTIILLFHKDRVRVHISIIITTISYQVQSSVL